MIKLLFFIFPLFGFFIQSEPKQVAKIEFKADGFTTDILGNVYLRKGEELKKYNQDGKLLNPYSDKSLGRITSVDATNFLKLVLFYRDFSKIMFLDNMLAPSTEPIQLQKFQYEQATLAASSHNNGLWLYQQFEFQLVRLSQNLKKTHETPNLMQLLGHPINPNFLMEVNNVVYLNNPETGILLFDIYGTYSKTIAIKGLTEFQVIEDKIVYFKNGVLKSYHLKKLEEVEIPLPEVNPINVRIEKNRLYLLTKDACFIYAL
jgi:hypothetical protein